MSFVSDCLRRIWTQVLSANMLFFTACMWAFPLLLGKDLLISWPHGESNKQLFRAFSLFHLTNSLNNRIAIPELIATNQPETVSCLIGCYIFYNIFTVFCMCRLTQFVLKLDCFSKCDNSDILFANCWKYLYSLAVKTDFKLIVLDDNICFNRNINEITVIYGALLWTNINKL